MLKQVNGNHLRNNLPAHGRFGPSSMKRILKCSGSTVQENLIDQGHSSAAAALGTQAHEAGELAVINNKRAEDYLSEEEHGQDTIDAVNIYIDHINSLKSGCFNYFLEGKYIYDENLFGSADFAGVSSDKLTLYISDYKNGTGYVEEERNEQMMTYAALCLIDNSMFSYDDICVIEKVTMTIVQPRAAGEPIRTYTCPVGEIFEFWAKLLIHLDECLEGTVFYNHGDHCHFCPRKINCPHLTELASKLLNVQPYELTKDELGEQLTAAKILKKRIEELEAYAYRQAEDKGSIPTGHKLVKKRSTRYWNDETEAYELFDELGIPEDKQSTSKITSPTQIEKILGKKRKDLITSYIKSVSTGSTLVPMSDKREAIEPELDVNYDDIADMINSMDAESIMKS